MSHIPAPLPSHDPLTKALADAIIDRLNLDHLAERIAEHLRQANDALPPGAGGGYDDPYPVTAIRAQLGRRGRPMAHLTFQKNYLDTGLLKLIDGPSRRNLYVRLGDWLKLKKEIGK